MISVKNINKYYNKNRRNENHVLRDVSVEFPSEGLVMLLGKSGSGKTTLLNIIGGLDKAEGGTLQINNETFRKYKPTQIDALRAHSIGYIFQNYYLFPEETVKENIRLPLKMIGIADEEEIDKRINTLLRLINMPQYKHRKAKQLSGGQQQRIAIVRALAKDPDVIIADEPTGNLDSKNTLALMRLLKEISKEKLVIMVTHEQTLASHYGDTIINIVDGEIITRSNTERSAGVDTTTDSDIYLGDFTTTPLESNGEDTILIHRDDTATPIKGRIIIKDNTLYLDINDTDFKQVHVLDEKSDTLVYDTTRDAASKESTAQTAIDYPPLEASYGKKRSVIPFTQVILQSLGKIRHASKASRLMYLAFIGAAAVFLMAFSMVANVFTLDESSFLDNPAYTYTIERRAIDSMDTLNELSDTDAFEAYAYGPSRTMTYTLPQFYQTPILEEVGSTLAPLSLTGATELIHGTFPEQPGQIVISQTYAQNLLDRRNIERTGITRMEDLLRLSYEAGGQTLTIAGIVDSNAPVVFTDDPLLYQQASSSMHYAYELFEDTLTITEGRAPDEGEILMNASMASGDFEPHSVNLDDETFEVVGLYEIPSTSEQSGYMLHTDALKTLAFERLEPGDTIKLYSDSQDAASAQLSDSGIDYVDTYAEQAALERAQRIDSAGGMLTFATITITASALAYLLIIRSSMLRRIQEIGIYRALGVKRLDVVKLFLVEIVVLMSVTSLLGYIGMFYVLRTINSATQELIDVFALGIPTFIGGLVSLYAIHIIFGLLPLSGVLRKTPAEIHATYDL